MNERDDSGVYPYHDVTYSQQLLGGLADLRPIMWDVVLRVGGEDIRANRIVLMAFSPFFSAMFKHRPTNDFRDTVDVAFTSANILNELVDFAYSGRIVITTSNVQDLFEAANFLNVVSVERACCTYIMKHLNVTNCLEIWLFASKHGCHHLNNVAKRFATRHFMDISEQSHILDLPEDLFLDLIENDNIVTEDKLVIPTPSQQELKIFRVALKYMQQHIAVSGTHLVLSILKRIRIALMDEETSNIIFDEMKELGYETEATEFKKITCQMRDDGFVSNDCVGWHSPRLSKLLRLSRSRALSGGNNVGTIANKFTDEPDASYVYIRDVTLWFRPWSEEPVLGGLRIRYSNGRTHTHGQTDTDHVHSFSLSDGERIVQIQSSHHWMINNLSFSTNRGTVYGPYGAHAHSNCDVLLPPNGKNGYAAWVDGHVLMTQGMLGIVNLRFMWAYYDVE